MVLDQMPGVSLAALGDATAQGAAVTSAIAAAMAEVDTRCRRTFSPPETAVTRFLDGGGGPILRVPDMVRLDAVSVGGAAGAPAHPYPLDGPPFRWIATGERFPQGYRNVAVTGLWGFGEAVPPDVARATAAMAAAEILGRIQGDRSGGARSQVTGLAREEFPEGGPYGDRIAALMQMACRLLMPYRRWVV
jgi:hypothetical protein